MINFTSEQINKAFDDLSPEKSDAMFGIDSDAKIKEVTTKYNLDEEQSKNIDFYVTLSIIGLLKEEQLSETISNELKMNPDMANKIYSDLKSFVFDGIRERIKETQERTEVLSQEDIATFDPRFENMPEKVKEAIELSNWRENLYKISTENKLNIEQMGILEDLTVKTMKNEIDPNNFETEVSSKISIEKEKIQSLVKEVSQKIFQEIRKIMMEEEAYSSEPEEDNQKEGFSMNLIENFEEEVPIPPYAKKEIEEKEEPINLEIKSVKSDDQEKIPESESGVLLAESIDKINLNKPNNSDFSVPKAEISKTQTQNPPVSSSPTKPHDPYREII